MARSRPAQHGNHAPTGSVLCCHIPDLSLQLTYRTQPGFQERPLALYTPDERVCAVSPLARQQGVTREMWNRQAQMRCPEIMLLPLDMGMCQETQDAFLGELSALGLPVEAQSWGSAYVDLHTVTKDVNEVRGIAADVGRSVRTALGDALQPVLGWDSGKFTARSAAMSTQPGRMRLVDKADEVRFLSPLAIAYLPLPPPSLQHLHWLGIQTLGQYATLPRTSVWQRFGAAGALAQMWAKGKDDRPVRNTLQATAESIEVELDPPTGYLHLVLAAVMEGLTARLEALRHSLEGCRSLRLKLSFNEGSERTLDIQFMEPVSEVEGIQATVSNRLHTLNWPGELASISIALEVAELAAGQLSLFPELDAEGSPLQVIAQKLVRHFGPRFYQGFYLDRDHPLAERRTRLEAIP